MVMELSSSTSSEAPEVDTPLNVALIVEVPSPKPEASPVVLTEATELLEDAQVVPAALVTSFMTLLL